MIQKIRDFINWILESKVGNGFAFLLYMVMIFVAGILLKATFVEMAGALLAGTGLQSGQRTYTKVSLTKAELNSGKDPCSDIKEPA